MPAVAVFENEEIAFFTVEAHLGGQRGIRRRDLVAQATGIVRQRSHTNRAVRGETLHLTQVGHLRGAHHQHGVTPFQEKPQAAQREPPGETAT
ncbi:hypothetical protein D9M69_730070 [compost metagenome]